MMEPVFYVQPNLPRGAFSYYLDGQLKWCFDYFGHNRLRLLEGSP